VRARREPASYLGVTLSSKLFTPVTIPAPQGEGLTVRNRAFVAPMCQYSVVAEDGVPTDWHLVHLGAMASGGFGLVTVEATGVEARGRISPRDLGLYTDEQMQAHARIVDFIHAQGAAAGIQLGHAGGKASTYPGVPGASDGTVPAAEGGWETVGPVSEPVFPHLASANALDADGITQVIEAFAHAAQLADQAGYDIIQLHGAHGYLIHQFLSPLTNKRTDDYGGSEEGRTRLVREIARAVRAVWPAHKPLGLRLSATDWVEGGWDVEASARLVKDLVAEYGVNWVDISSGGLTNGSSIPVGTAYQAPLAAAITNAVAELGAAGAGGGAGGARAGSRAVVSAVGLIEDAKTAESLLVTGQADAISIGRAALRNPHWATAAAAELRVAREDLPRSTQYWRAW